MAARHINIVNLQSTGGKCENPIGYKGHSISVLWACGDLIQDLHLHKDQHGVKQEQSG